MNKKEKINQLMQHFTAKIAYLIGVSVLFTIIILMAVPAGWHEQLILSYLRRPLLMILNCWPVFATLILLCLILTNFKRAWLFFYPFWIFFFLAANIKMSIRHETLKLNDLSLVMPAFKIATHYKEQAMMVLGALIACLIFGYILYRIQPSFLFGIKEKIILLILLTVGTLTLAPYYMSDDVAHTMGTTRLNAFVELPQALRNGAIYSIFHQSQYVFSFANPTEIKAGGELCSKFKNEKIPEDKKINVCVVLLESFKDFSNSQIEFMQDPYESFHQIKDQSLHGHLITDVYGGGTIETELSVLCGFSSQAYPKVFKKPRMNYVRYFYDNGYTTEAMHPNTGSFYNRMKYYPNIGFQSFLFTENFFHYDNNQNGLYPDQELFKDVAQRFKEHKGKPYFNYTATMQNHGPYEKSQLYVEQPFFAFDSSMDLNGYHELNNYLAGVCDTGKALQVLCDDFQAIEEPVVFVCFGDHSPSLSDESYQILGYQTDENTVEGIRNRYETPYLIWANEQAKSVLNKNFEGQLLDLDPKLLLAELFQYLGFRGYEYSQLLQENLKECSVIKSNFYVIYQQDSMQINERTEKIAFDRKLASTYIRNHEISPIEDVTYYK